jgi:hypothetical protein
MSLKWLAPGPDASNTLIACDAATSALAALGDARLAIVSVVGTARWVLMVKRGHIHAHDHAAGSLQPKSCS